jgi:DNA-directed RNA polymerase-4 subunit 1
MLPRLACPSLPEEVLTCVLRCSPPRYDVTRRHNLNSKLKEDEENLVLDLLRQGHAKADEKIGVGVKHIKVGAHPEYSDSRCFHVVRTDDTTADFSYRKVCSLSLSVSCSRR